MHLSRLQKKQQEFISFLVNILVHQRVRMDVIRELLRAERMKNLQFSRALHDYSNALIPHPKQAVNLKLD